MRPAASVARELISGASAWRITRWANSTMMYCPRFANAAFTVWVPWMMPVASFSNAPPTAPKTSR